MGEQPRLARTLSRTGHQPNGAHQENRVLLLLLFVLDRWESKKSTIPKSSRDICQASYKPKSTKSKGTEICQKQGYLLC